MICISELRYKSTSLAHCSVPLDQSARERLLVSWLYDPTQILPRHLRTIESLVGLSSLKASTSEQHSWRRLVVLWSIERARRVAASLQPAERQQLDHVAKMLSLVKWFVRWAFVQWLPARFVCTEFMLKYCLNAMLSLVKWFIRREFV